MLVAVRRSVWCGRRRGGSMPATAIDTVTTVTALRPALSRADIAAARQRLGGRVRHTPVVRSDELDRAAGRRLWLKAENLQHGGSYKMRGALLAVGRLAAEGSRGVIAQSTGNHAIAVALAAADIGLPAVLVLPADAAPAKVTRIREAGADVIQAGHTLDDRLAVLAEMCDRLGYDVVDPYQDPDVVAGQGTATAELLSQVSAAGGWLAAVVVPVGGGSGVAGACLATSGTGTAVVAAEPAAVPALSCALRAGHPVTVPVRPTIADGLRPDRIGELPFALCHERVARVETVDEARIAAALRLALMKARLLIEPAAATALAVAIGGQVTGGEQAGDVGVLLTGGNIGEDVLASLLAGAAN
jgi:threo-3-hydroxy-L-aspartate ammonia-lyase